jgi:hypothetical protein
MWPSVNLYVSSDWTDVYANTTLVYLTREYYRTGIPIRTENKYLEPVRKKSEIVFGSLNLFIFIFLVFQLYI